jgi:hypothetical protein
MQNLRRTGGKDEINVFKFIKFSWGKGEDSQSVEAPRKLTNHIPASSARTRMDEAIKAYHVASLTGSEFSINMVINDL